MKNPKDAPNFIALPDGSFARPIEIKYLLKGGPDQIGDNWMQKYAIKICMRDKSKIICRYEDKKERDTVLKELVQVLNFNI